MNKREAVLNLLQGDDSYTPAAFFLHFDPVYHTGQAAVEKHLEFFRYTGMDFVKIQFEDGFPHLDSIQKPEDWAAMPLYKKDFYENQLRIAEGLIRAAGKEALVVQTLYSPFMCACHTTSSQMVTEHMRQNPAAVKRGMEIITESLMIFVKELIKLGIDGLYASTQGGEARRFEGASPAESLALFNECIKPYDLALMREASAACPFNILHICDYSLGYDDLTRFLDYPGQVVNCNLVMENGVLTAQEVEQMFGRPFMGGMQRKGVLATGRPEEVRAAAQDFLRTAPRRMILAADCTVPSSTPWDNLRAAIEAAHARS